MTLDARTTARVRLLEELREHALVIGEVVLTSGRTAQYLVDAKRAILRPAGFRALAELVAAQARAWRRPRWAG
jgi:orotate phosphoribosyltransferase